MSSDCLGDDTIAAMIEGRLTASALERAHLVRCDACRQLVAAAMPRPLGDALAASGALDLPIAFAGEYRIDGVLGEGGGGQVFAATHLILGRAVAIKVLRRELVSSPLALERFQREARLVASLQSPHTVNIYNFGVLPGGVPFLVMERLWGEDLATIVERGPVALPVVLDWMTAAADALGEAHARGIVHRDVKPSNLFAVDGGRFKVLDFGLAKLAGEPSMTATGVIMGSPRYMAPEQITGGTDVGPRADIWALGATLYHLVSGRPPFEGHTIEGVFGAILMAPLPPLQGLPPWLSAVIRRALERDPDARFQSMAELAAALRPPLGNPAPEVAVARRRGIWPLVAVAAIVVVASLAYVAGRAAATAEPAAVNVAPAPAATTWDVPAAPASSAGTGGALGNLDEDRLRHRLLDGKWKITLVDRQDFPGCHHTRMSVEREGSAGGDVLLLNCDSPAYAASEAARLRRGFSRAWVETSDDRVVMAMFPDEHASKAVADELLKP